MYRLKAKFFNLYYFVKYLPFRIGHLPGKQLAKQKGFVGLQIDALGYDNFVYALENGYLPRLKKLAEEKDYVYGAYNCGLPSATSYVQAGVFYGYNENIPAFRWYEKKERRLITCNLVRDVQYYREKIPSQYPGILKGGSSYVNLLDGDADRAVFTASSSRPQNFFEKMGAARFILLLGLHPLRTLRTLVASFLELGIEILDRLVSRHKGRATVMEGIFPLTRIICNTIFRELQTLFVLVDIYLGIPKIYTTFSGYDELAHHFGPRSRQALQNLKRIDACIGEVVKMVTRFQHRLSYDLIVLSDHGMVEAITFQAKFGHTLGEDISKIMTAENIQESFLNEPEVENRNIFNLASELKKLSENSSRIFKFIFGDLSQRMLRSLDKTLLRPETYFIDKANDIVITYSSSLAHLYFSKFDSVLYHEEIVSRYGKLYNYLLHHPGIGLVITRSASENKVMVASGQGKVSINQDKWFLIEGINPVLKFGKMEDIKDALYRLVNFYNSGDIIIIGGYIGEDIVCFDDQVGAHGAFGGDQCFPFLLVPSHKRSCFDNIRDAHHLYRFVFGEYGQTKIE